MKAVATHILVAASLVAASACSSNEKREEQTDPREKFVGEWKSADTNAETHTYIKHTGDTFYIHEGQQDIVGAYDAATQSILIDNGVKKVPVHYLPETDQIMVTGGSRDAKFSRVIKAK